MLKRLAILAALLAQPALAEELTQDFLEQPGKVWVSADVPFAAKEGFIIPLISFARFEGGVMETGFFTGNAITIFDATCALNISCETVTDRAVYRRGPYEIRDDGITSSAGLLGQWVFDRRDVVAHVAASDVLLGDTALLRREGDTLVQYRAGGERTYHAVPADEMKDALYLAYSAEVSLTVNYGCTSRAVHALKSEEPATVREEALLALIRVGRFLGELTMESDKLDPLAYSPNPRELSEEDQNRKNQIWRVTAAARKALNFYMDDLTAGGPSPNHPDTIAAETVEEVRDFHEKIANSAPDPDALFEAMAALDADLRLAAYAAARIRPKDGQSYDEAYQNEVCQSVEE